MMLYTELTEPATNVGIHRCQESAYTQELIHGEAEWRIYVTESTAYPITWPQTICVMPHQILAGSLLM